MSCQEQINRHLLVIHHENIQESASLRYLNLNLESQNIRVGRKTYEYLFFSFMGLCFKSPSCNRIPVVSIAAVFFKVAAFIIATHGQKPGKVKLSYTLCHVQL